MIRLLVLMVALASPLQADQRMLDAVNAERERQGRTSLQWNDRLEAAALAHALDMAQSGRFAHEGSDGSSVRDRVDGAGYRGCFRAENIAMGQRSLSEVMTSWMQSRGDRRNILHRQAKEIGVVQGRGNRWVMVLAAPC
jgi:uncharacterized protein YkwD